MAAGIFEKMDLVIIKVQDLAKSRDWYQQVLRFQPSFEDTQARLAVFDLGGITRLCLYELKPGEELPPSGSVGSYPTFLAEDLEKIYALLKSKGVKVGDTIHRGEGADWFAFFDPDGNRTDAVHY